MPVAFLIDICVSCDVFAWMIRVCPLWRAYDLVVDYYAAAGINVSIPSTHIRVCNWLQGIRLKISTEWQVLRFRLNLEAIQLSPRRDIESDWSSSTLNVQILRIEVF